MRKLIKSNRKVYFTTVKGNKYRIYRRMDLYKTSKNKSFKINFNSFTFTYHMRILIILYVLTDKVKMLYYT